MYGWTGNTFFVHHNNIIATVIALSRHIENIMYVILRRGDYGDYPAIGSVKINPQDRGPSDTVVVRPKSQLNRFRFSHPLGRPPDLQRHTRILGQVYPKITKKYCAKVNHSERYVRVSHQITRLTHCTRDLKYGHVYARH